MIQATLRNTLALLAILSFLAPVPALGQEERQLFEIEAGGGYLYGSGERDRISSVDVSAGFVFWFHRSAGVAGTFVYAPNGGAYEMLPPSMSDNPPIAGNTKLYSITFRYRRAFGESTEMNLGGGVGFGSSGDPGDPDFGGGSFAGYSFEILLGQRLTDRWGLKGGLCIDAVGADAHFLRPVILGTVSF